MCLIKWLLEGKCYSWPPCIYMVAMNNTFLLTTINFIKCMHFTSKVIWMPDIGEILECWQERGNSDNLYTVSVIKDDVHHYI